MSVMQSLIWREIYMYLIWDVLQEKRYCGSQYKMYTKNVNVYITNVCVTFTLLT